jgi:hypothetical protein
MNSRCVGWENKQQQKQIPFGDDNKKSNCESNGQWLADGYIPPIAKYAMDGAPVSLWLFEKEQRHQQ